MGLKTTSGLWKFGRGPDDCLILCAILGGLSHGPEGDETPGTLLLKAPVLGAQLTASNESRQSSPAKPAGQLISASNLLLSHRLGPFPSILLLGSLVASLVLGSPRPVPRWWAWHSSALRGFCSPTCRCL